VKPWTTLGSAQAPGGGTLVLQQRDDEFVIRLDGHVLMGSRTSGSERLMSEVGCEPLRAARAPRVLIGGLGLGFTLRAALDVLPADAEVEVAEIVPEVVAWNRGPLAPLAGSPLADARVRVSTRDVREAIGEGGFDAILLDVDNGPNAFTLPANRALYDDRGLARIRAALRPRGTLVVWSVGPDAAFVARLVRAGFSAGSRAVHDRRRHTLFVATVTSGAVPQGGRRGPARASGRARTRP
jgi:spermidine synthase